MRRRKPPDVPLPKGWSKHVRSAVLHVISLAQYITVYTRSWAADSVNGRVRLKAENERLKQEVALLKEQSRINGRRTDLTPPHRRPHFPATERLAILELRAARGWSIRQTADAFHVTSATVRSWVKQVDEKGPEALVQLPQPVNKFPAFVRYAIQRLKTLNPAMGKAMIAMTLCRAGLHLGTTTVGRILKEPPHSQPEQPKESSRPAVTAREPNHVWHFDLTSVPIHSGFWIPWLPFALPQRWPCCWWVGAVVDHFSRRITGIGVFAKRPDCRTVCAFLGRTIRDAGRMPKYLVCDRDCIFDCQAFRSWVYRQGIQPPRYGAVGKHGSIAVVERCILSIKRECVRAILVPLRHQAFRQELHLYAEWFNEHRPHETLGGRTPNEVYFGRQPANRRPRIEPRPHWPRRSRCAKPQTLVAGQPGDRFTMQVQFHKQRRHLPIVTLRRAA